jgi:LssY-like putative type I secretion system component LssY
VVIRAFSVEDRVVIPKGSIVYGRVRKEVRVGLGLIHERAGLELSFDEYETPDGRRFPLTAKLVSIDNAREQVTPEGRIKGVLAANNPGNLLNGLWERPSANIALRSLVGLTGAANQIWLKYSMGPIGAASLFAMRCFIVAFPEPEIYLPPGADMKLTVKEPLAPEVAIAASDCPNLDLANTASELSHWVKGKLDPISHRNGREVSDLFNVVLLGSRDQIVSAFNTAGWSSADPRSLRTSSHVYQAFSAMRSYASAPVSNLFFRGSEPDLVFEKSLDTVTQRHHVRFWKIGSLNGQEVWLGAATHDTGVKFKLKHMTFSHQIDRDIDPERDKIITDLSFSECSGNPAFFDGSDDSPAYKSGQVTTDGRVAVLAARFCAAPPDRDELPARPGNKLTRLTRRVVLETRNYLLRDNAYYWGYRMVRSRISARQGHE